MQLGTKKVHVACPRDLPYVAQRKVPHNSSQLEDATPSLAYVISR